MAGRGNCWIVAVALVVMLAEPTRAQQAGTSGPISLGDIFMASEGSNALLVTLDNQAAFVDAVKAVPFRDCRNTLATITVIMKAGDPLFQEAFAAARRDVLIDVLRNAGVPGDQYEFKIDGHGAADEVRVEHMPRPDREAPRLHTTSVPPKGKKVQPGDKIAVTMEARDDINGWQTGIRRTQLLAEGDRLVDARDYERTPAPCSSSTLHRTFIATYEVPRRPPLVVRLRAITEDYADHIDTDVGEFPIGDWYGRMEWFFHGKEDLTRGPDSNRSETKFSGSADLSATYDGNGNLTGTLAGSQKLETMWWGYPHGNGEVCRGSSPDTPVSARVLGSWTPGANALVLQLADFAAAMQPTWSGGGQTLTCTPLPPIDMSATLASLGRALQPAGDGSWRAEFAQADELTESRYVLTVRRASD